MFGQYTYVETMTYRVYRQYLISCFVDTQGGGSLSFQPLIVASLVFKNLIHN